MKSSFNLDAKFERNSIEYLKDRKVFEKLGFSNFHFTDDRETQLSGSDMVADFDGKTGQVVDIKSVASMLPTFSQEIANGNSRRIGWIMNNELKTDYYLYVWHNVEGESYYTAKKLIAEDYSYISDTVVALVSKKDVQKYITDNTGIPCDENNANKILRISDRILKTNGTVYIWLDNGEIKAGKKRPNVPVYITRSDSIAEQPLNFIVRRSVLEKLGKNILVK